MYESPGKQNNWGQIQQFDLSHYWQWNPVKQNIVSYEGQKLKQTTKSQS